MSFQNSNSEFESDRQQSDLGHEATGFILSLATAPFLVTFLAGEKLLELLLLTGHASEEVFRGDRLPILNFPSTNQKSDR
jgi:hypothetical protein